MSLGASWIKTKINEPLAVPDFQAVQFTFHRFVPVRMVIAVLISQHHWNKTAGTTVKKLLRYAPSFLQNRGTNVAVLFNNYFFKVCGAHGAKSPVACQKATGLHFFCALGDVVPKFPLLWMVRKVLLAVVECIIEQPISAMPNLVLVQLLGQFPELLPLSSRSRSLAILGPSRLSR